MGQTQWKKGKYLKKQLCLSIFGLLSFPNFWPWAIFYLLAIFQCAFFIRHQPTQLGTPVFKQKRSTLMSFCRDRKSLQIAKNHPKPSQGFSEQFGPFIHQVKVFGKNSRQEVHPKFAKNLGRHILGIPFLAPTQSLGPKDAAVLKILGRSKLTTRSKFTSGQ